MGKEITLDELANSSAANRQRRMNSIKPVESPSGGAVRMTPNQVAEHMIAAGKMERKVENVVDAPLVDAAFKSMDRTLQERKDWIQNEMMPIVNANAQEMALENELGADDNNEPEQINKPLDQTDIPDVPDFGDDEDDDPVAALDAEMKSRVNPQQVVEIPTPVVAPTPTRKNITTKTAPDLPAVNNTTADEDEGTLDELMNDLEKQDDMNITDEEESGEEMRERFKKTFENVSIISDPIDLSKFKIRTKPVSSTTILNNIQNTRIVHKADWPLFHSKRCVTFTECSGPELDTTRRNIADANGINGVIISLRFIYNHIDDANKPDFETWCKLIRTEDIESNYHGIYRACYSRSNLIARQCKDPACGKTSLVDTDINSMVKYGREDVEEDDPEAIKKEFMDLFNKDTTTSSTAFESQLMQISDSIVISYSPATLYSTFIQYSTLTSKITDRYSRILDTMAYIDNFYQIDKATHELVPIEIKVYPNNFDKTVLSKLKIYTAILKSLTNDQYNMLMGKLGNMIEASKIRYVLPKCTCPECGKEIDEEPVESMLNLLFTRAQLAQIRSL